MLERFDVEAFAKMVDEEMGAGWVIWSLTWRGSRFGAPLKSVDAIVPDHTMEKDFIGSLADALNRRGIKFMLYYHSGHADREFWSVNFPTKDCRADRSRFFRNWTTIVSEIGQRYGERLAGWFFDDGSVYYPAPFEQLTQAAKAGNPKRIVSYNNWAIPLCTDFQDIMMGEGIPGDRNLPVGGNGIYPASHTFLPRQQAHGMICIDGPDWGIWRPDTRIVQVLNGITAAALVKDASQRGMPLSLNYLMYEDGTISPESLQTLRDVKTAIRGGEGTGKQQQ
jgi:hypothetical protein